MKSIKNKKFPDYFTNDNERLFTQVQRISNSVSLMPEILCIFQSGESPKYCYTSAGSYKEKCLYIPPKFKKDDLFKCIENHFKNLNIKNLSQLYIMLHEIGHAKHHETLGNNNPYYYPVIIQQGNNLHYLYNGASTENKINEFISENYKEAFADCFAAFALYKEYGNIEIFDKISAIRKERYQYFKKNNGNEFIHPNADYYAVLYLKKYIEKLNKDHKTITFQEIENHLETCILRGTIKIIKKELETNDAFLIEFRKFAKEFDKNKKDTYLLNQIKEKLIKDNMILNKIEEYMENVKKSSVIDFFIEFQKRSESNVISLNNIIEFSQNIKFERVAVPKNPLMKIKNYSISNCIESISNKIQQLRNDEKINNKLNL